MDPLTHALVGGVVAQTLRAPRRRFWILMFLGEAPDLDVFFGGLGSWAFWLHHRGITHSLFGLAIQAVLFVWLFSKWDPGSYRERLWQYALPLFLHAACDYLTSYGIPLLSPFNFQEFSVNVAPAITVVPLIFMLGGVVYLYRRGRMGWGATRPLWLGWAIYLFTCFTGQAYAKTFVRNETGKISVVAGVINPFLWTAVVQPNDCCTYHTHVINVLTGKKKEGRTVEVDTNDFPIATSMKAANTKRLIDLLRWPVARVTPLTNGGWMVEWGRMLFSSRGAVRGLMAVEVSPQGEILSEHRIFNFWNPYEKQVDS